MRNNTKLLTLVAIVLAVAVIVVGAVLAAALGFIQIPGISQTTPTPTPAPGTAVNPTGRGGPCFNSPYGFTTVHADAHLVSFYKQLNVCWVRYQYHWAKIETSPGKYDWSQVDAAVAAMNAANIHVDFAIQDAPQWDRTQICSANGQPFLPGPTQLAAFATVLAERYDGKHGHGYIDSFEIGNEEYDNYFVPGYGNNQPCRSASYYEPVLKAGYQAIKAVDPQALVGMFGLWWHYMPHIQDFMTQLYADGYGQYMDYMNFHYYHSGGDPSVTNGDDPSFDSEWQTMHNIAAKYGFASKPIWVTEVGWATNANPNAKTGVSSNAISPTTQANYMHYVLTEAANSKVVAKVFWFTINSPNEADNIYLPDGSSLPAVQVLEAMVQQRPQWN